MRVGCPAEVKDQEFRVGLTPAGAHELAAHGHEVLVQSGAGDAVGFADDAYRAAGAVVVPDAAAVFAGADMVVKVKEPQAQPWCRDQGCRHIGPYPTFVHTMRT